MLSSEELMEKKSEGMVKWEGFLQRMALRVLLVEADDSTRQIIAALLRKSTFRGLFSSLLLNFIFLWSGYVIETIVFRFVFEAQVQDLWFSL